MLVHGTPLEPRDVGVQNCVLSLSEINGGCDVAGWSLSLSLDAAGDVFVRVGVPFAT